MAGKKEWDNVCTQVNTCALTGAAAFFAGIPDAAIVANGPLWCYFYALRYVEKSCAGVAKRFFGTQPDNNAVVYGTEECLLETLVSIRQSTRPSVLLIENSCSVSLIGDDIAGIAAQAAMPYPVVCMDSGGLTGGFWEGYRAAAKAYFAVMPLEKRSIVQPCTVNLLGCSVSYYNAANDLRELKRLLELAGYKVLACPGAGSSTAEIAAMTQAELNLVIHAELGLMLAQDLQQQYGIPYLSLPPPYGLAGSLDWLNAIGQALPPGSNGLQAVQQEADKLHQRLRTTTREMQRLWGEPWFERSLVAAPSSVAFALAQALRSEWIATGSLTVVLHDGAAAYPTPACIDSVLDGQNDSQAIADQLANLAPGLLLASSQEKALLQQQAVTEVVCQNISLPVHDEIILHDRPFMGFLGSCHMTERLWNQYMNSCQWGR